jgi:hypothetical protein
MRVFVWVAIVVTLAAATGAAAKPADWLSARFATFRTPSGNIVCQYLSTVFPDGRSAFQVECGIRSGLVGARPEPGRNCGDPVTNRVFLQARGRGRRVRRLF